MNCAPKSRAAARASDPIADFSNDIERTLNPVDTEAAEARAAAAAASGEPTPPDAPAPSEAPAPVDEPAPRSGEYRVSETPAGEPHPETAQP